MNIFFNLKLLIFMNKERNCKRKFGLFSQLWFFDCILVFKKWMDWDDCINRISSAVFVKRRQTEFNSNLYIYKSARRN